jgi:Co/Zn/Cd efflux system component
MALFEKALANDIMICSVLSRRQFDSTVNQNPKIHVDSVSVLIFFSDASYPVSVQFYDRGSDLLQKFRKIQRVLVYVLILNLTVAFAKIIYGNLTGALSMSADGYHSLSDGVTNIVELTGCFIASYPPDRDHPYGHQKYETLASFFVALLLIFVGFEIFQNAINRFLTHSKPEITNVSFLVMFGTMCINYLHAI